MRLVKSFLFAAVVAATIALPSDRANAFIMDGAGVASLKVFLGDLAPILSVDGVPTYDGVLSESSRRTTTSYTTVPGDKLRTENGRGVLDRFGVSLSVLRAANPDALVPVCVGAFLNPNGLVTCREVNWYLRERVTLTIPRDDNGRGHYHNFIF